MRQSMHYAMRPPRCQSMISTYHTTFDSKNSQFFFTAEKFTNPLFRISRSFKVIDIGS